jgi:peptide/nickel transport system permease protein
MLRFVGRRLGFVLLSLLLSSILIFAATQILPGDVARMILGRFATEEALGNLREELGLNRPLVVQYGDWLFNFVQGDWGTSVSTNTEVRGLVFERLRNSGMLALVGFLMYVPLGIILGLVAAVKRNSWLDQVISVG